MKIVQINYSDIDGGAARAAYRLHKGLLKIGEASVMIVRHKQTSDKEIILAQEPVISKNKDINFFKDDIQNYISCHRTEMSNTIFSFSYPGIDISKIPQAYTADIINLHWVAAFYQSPTTLRKLFDMNKPVIWTLHDQWAFTGGCHYTAGCGNYRNICESCPQLSNNLFNLPSRILLDKVDLFKNANLTIVTPSKWLKESAMESTLFKDLRIEVIPNSIETHVFIPLIKEEAKRRLGINPDMITLLFGTENALEKRKGYNELLQAVAYCRSDSQFNSLLARNKIKLLVFGNPGKEMIQTGVPIHSLGYVNSDKKLTEVYSAADLFVLPSLEDNLPNTMLESMSCGTPIIAFNVGGMPDLIHTGITGELVPVGDTVAMGEAILNMISDKDKVTLMSNNCRAMIENNFCPDVQANKYLDLYRDLLKTSAQNGISNEVSITNELFLFRYTLEADASTGENFKTIEEEVKMTVTRNSLARQYSNVKNDIKKIYDVIYSCSPTFLRKLFSFGVRSVKKLLPTFL